MINIVATVTMFTKSSLNCMVTTVSMVSMVNAVTMGNVTTA